MAHEVMNEVIVTASGDAGFHVAGMALDDGNYWVGAELREETGVYATLTKDEVIQFANGLLKMVAAS